MFFDVVKKQRTFLLHKKVVFFDLKRKQRKQKNIFFFVFFVYVFFVYFASNFKNLQDLIVEAQ